jgi:hypothetical protein
MGLFLYNDTTYKKQADYNTISIYFGSNKMKNPENGETLEDNPYVIKAVMQEQFRFGVKANWEQIMKAGGFSDTIEKVMLVTGNKVQNAGGITKQYYMGTEHIPISVKFRIYDDAFQVSNGLTARPLTAVNVLTRSCLPANGASIETYIKELGDTVKTGITLVKGLVEDIGSGEGFIKSLNHFFATLTGNVGNEVCFVTFGPWMSGFFVVKSVDFTYSKEVSVDGGPYYVDFDVQFETLMIPTKGSVSLNPDVSQGSRTTFALGTNKLSRIEFTGQQEN